MNEDMMKLAEEYAAAAQTLLEEQGEPYTEEDIAKVAEFLIDSDYPSEDEAPEGELTQEEMSKLSEEDYEKLAEEAFVLGFEDEMEKQAKWPTPNQMAADFGAYILSMLAKNPAALKPGGMKAKAYDFFAKHPKTLGYGTAATGALAVGGAGYGATKLMQKKSSFEKEAFSPNQAMRDFANYMANKAAVGDYVGSKVPFRNKAAIWMSKNPLKTGYGTVGLGALGVGGVGTGIYNAVRD